MGEGGMGRYIFRQYDIRGNVVEDFPPEGVVSFG